MQVHRYPGLDSYREYISVAVVSVTSCNKLKCHKNLTVNILYFSDIDMCEDCVVNTEHASSQYQLAYRTKKLVSKSKSYNT